MTQLESWLKTRRKILVITMIRDQSKSVVTTTETLERCVSHALGGKHDELNRSFDALQQKEKAADLLKKKIVAELTKGELPPSDREDLMRLAREINHVIDWINETGRILVEFNLDEAPEEIKKIVPDVMRVVKKCVLDLDICINKLIDRKFQDALKAADEVERLEEEMDYLHRQARRKIAGFKTGAVEIGEAILISQLIESFENITDRCEDTCDLIRAIAVAAPIII
jgi:predicted phosphate transport protein (TIGR00153 family)